LARKKQKKLLALRYGLEMGRSFLERALSICDSVVLTFLLISFIYLLLTMDSEEQRSLGYTEFFQKLSPEAQDWMAQVVSGRVFFELSETG